MSTPRKSAADPRMELNTPRFGNIEIYEDQIIIIPEGLLGFEEVKRYVIVEDRDGGPFKWLQAVDEADLAFIIMDPRIFYPEYRVEIPKADLRELKLEDIDQAQVYVIVAIPERIDEMSANLRGPVVINPRERLAKQVVLMDQKYKTHHRILQELNHRAGKGRDGGIIHEVGQ